MNDMTKLKGFLSFAAIIVFSYAVFGARSIPSSAKPVSDGNALYAAKCSVCHSKDGRGTPNWRAKGQPDFTDAKWQQSRTDAQIAAFTKEGKGKYMPAFKSKLSDEDIAAVVARVRAFGRK
jgi:cytochrome c6